MEFGKLADVSTVDFSLPDTPPETLRLIGQYQSRTKPFAPYLGSTGWSMKAWVGKWYPAGTKSQEYLRHYSRLFNTIELNTTHYRIPDPDLVRRWRLETPTGFRFCPKIPQTISHFKRLSGVNQAVSQFCNAIAHFEDRLGPSFIQLPPTFGPDALPRLSRFLEEWPEGFPLHIELRHPDWFGESAQALAVWDILEKTGTGTVLTDVSGRRDVLHMRLSTPVLMLRFVGNSLHPSDYDRLVEWQQRILEWKAQGLQEIYLFMHQPDGVLVPEISQWWIQKLNEADGFNLTEPRQVPQQGSLF